MLGFTLLIYIELKMADKIQARLDSALKIMENIGEAAGKYLKIEAKEDIQEAVRIIRDCFIEMRTNLCDNREHGEPQKEVKETQTDMTQEEDSAATGQVAPSISKAEETSSDNHHITTPEGQPPHYSPQTGLPTQSNGDTSGKDTADMKRNIEYIMDFLTNKLSAKIEEKINQSLQKNKNETTSLSSTTQYKTPDREATRGKTRGGVSANTGTETRTYDRRENTNIVEESVEAANYNTGEGEDQQENAWNEVIYKKGRRDAALIGTKQTIDLQAEEKKAWLYVRRLRNGTTEEMIKKYLHTNGVRGEIECEELRTKGTSKAFKIGIPFTMHKKTENTEFWPAGTMVRRFRFHTQRRYLQNEGAYPDEYY